MEGASVPSSVISPSRVVGLECFEVRESLGWNFWSHQLKGQFCGIAPVTLTRQDRGWALGSVHLTSTRVTLHKCHGAPHFDGLVSWPGARGATTVMFHLEPSSSSHVPHLQSRSPPGPLQGEALRPGGCSSELAAASQWSLKVLCVASCKVGGVSGQEEGQTFGQVLLCPPCAGLGPHQQ